MGVKGIFKALIGTIVIMALVAMITEYINIATSSAQMKGMMLQSIRKACDYFAQETYKDGAVGNVVGNMKDIKTTSGRLAGSGRFFMSADAAGVYNEIYRNSEFKQFMLNNAGKWKNLDMLYYGLYGGSVPGGYVLSNDEKEFGKNYAQTKMTALNLGVAYLDRQVLSRIMRYNLITVLSNGNPNNIYESAPVPYVLYRGFKIYYEDIRVDSINYTVYDTTVEADRDAFQALTGIDTGSLGLTGDSSKICVANINYSIRLGYGGVSPLKKIMEYIWNHEVKGLSDSAPTIIGETFDENNSTVMTQSSISGSMAVDGKIIYYIIN